MAETKKKRVSKKATKKIVKKVVKKPAAKKPAKKAKSAKGREPTPAGVQAQANVAQLGSYIKAAGKDGYSVTSATKDLRVTRRSVYRYIEQLKAQGTAVATTRRDGDVFYHLLSK